MLTARRARAWANASSAFSSSSDTTSSELDTELDRAKEAADLALKGRIFEHCTKKKLDVILKRYLEKNES